jgi:hypothetical protein
MTPTEAAYRRGVHQSLEFAVDLLTEVRNIEAGRRRVTKAAEIARRLRTDRGRDHVALLDEIRACLGKKTVYLRQCSGCRCPTRFTSEDLARARLIGADRALLCDDCVRDRSSEPVELTTY